MPATSSALRPTVFISFATIDRALATEFQQRLLPLLGYKVNCFLAPKSIEAGANWPAEVEWHLGGAACIVILLSDSAAASTWVLFEAGVGRGRGVDVIPIAFPGFDIDRNKPPLSFLQSVTVTSVDELNGVLARIGKALNRTVRKMFTTADLVAIASRAMSPRGDLKAIPLLTRRAVFEEATRLVANCHLNSTIRGVSSLVDTKDSPDKYMRRFDEAVRKQFGAAVREGGRIRYEVVLGIHRDAVSGISQDAKIAIGRRVQLFRDIGALSRLRMRENPDAWSMNLLLVNDSDAILAFPEGSGSRLRCGLKISGSALVAPIVRWYEHSLRKRSRVLRAGDYN